MKLEKYLRMHNVSVQDFSRKCGISRGTIYNLLNGSNATFATIQKIEGITNKEVNRYDLHKKAYEIWP